MVRRNRIPADNPQPDIDAADAMYVKALELRNFEINQLAQRNNFFMIFQGVLLAGVLQSEGKIPVISFLACCAGLFVSLFQTGMAAGAKYWQDRWEYEVERAERIMLREMGTDPERGLLVRMFPSHTRSIKDRMKVRFLRRRREGPPLRDRFFRKKGEALPLSNRFLRGKPEGEPPRRRFLRGKQKWPSVVDLLIVYKPSVSRIPIYTGLVLSLIWLLLLLCTIKSRGGLSVPDFIVGFDSTG